MNKYTFVLSTGRTRTQFFARLFSDPANGVLAVHEPRPSYHLRIMSNAHSCGRLSEGMLLRVYLNARQRFFGSLGNKRYLEAHNFIYGSIEAFKAVDSVPGFIHIVRDPRDHIVSYLNHGGWSGYKWLAANLVPYWQPDVRNLLRTYPGRITPPVRFAAVWTHINTFLTEKGESASDYHEFRFEDILNPPHAGLERLIKVMGLQASREKISNFQIRIKSAEHAHIGKWQTWFREECRAVQQICGPLMQRYGYGREFAWLERVANA